MNTSFPFHLKDRIQTSFLNKANKLISGLDDAVGLLPLFTHSDFDKDHTPVLLFPTAKEAISFKNHLSFFSPQLKAHLLPSYDVSIYSRLPISPSTISQRIHWLHRAQNAKKNEMFLLTVKSFLQKSLHFMPLLKSSFEIVVGEELPDDFFQVLDSLGYSSRQTVEDFGDFANRGGIIDVFSPAHTSPIRIELFADTIESIRFFDPDTQKSLSASKKVFIVTTRETLLSDVKSSELINKVKPFINDEQLLQDLVHSLNQNQYHYFLDYLYPLVSKTSSPLEHFNDSVRLWLINPMECQRQADSFFENLKKEQSYDEAISFSNDHLHSTFELNTFDPIETIKVSNFYEEDNVHSNELHFPILSLNDFIKQSQSFSNDSKLLNDYVRKKIKHYLEDNYTILIACQGEHQTKKTVHRLDQLDFSFKLYEDDYYDWHSLFLDKERIKVLKREFDVPLNLKSEKIIILPAPLLYLKTVSRRTNVQQAKDFYKKAQSMSFAELKEGQLVVHSTHGVGEFEGFKKMSLNGVDNEFLQIKYKGNDKLYLPVYRIGQIQKYIGPANSKLLDKLGTNGWSQTKTKVKKKLRDIASDLIKLYAQRKASVRPPFSEPTSDFYQFCQQFPYEETQDQTTAIDSILTDLVSSQPMDRLICGDVGFGKTEVAMRAAFKIVEEGKQVVVIAPTTVLSLQHFESFKKRFKNWPFKIVALNRFVSNKQVKEHLESIKSNETKIIIGTHRVLSQDVKLADLGLLIIDEEQKFGVKHKEKIRQLKSSVDTLALSATPIPRTLNMSLLGIRDLSLITTPPVDRTPTRTFVTKFDKNIIKNAVDNELKRGGQIFFVHNRVQSIYGLTDELRTILPNVRIRVAHGQMQESELEKTVLAFFNHEFDLLVCTTIVESGIDVPNANTIFIDKAHHLGLSQLYQLRGRVGRSTKRAYCYLLVPSFKDIDKEGQERLKVIQENTELGSGFKVAQYDLEIRGSGSILGESQSGHLQSIGYEMYTELLQEAIEEERGIVSTKNKLDPEINIKVPAYIPDNYITDIRTRLAYYKTLSNIENEADIEDIESELKDQFGTPPIEVINLMGVMLIRKKCKELMINDLTAGLDRLSLSLNDNHNFNIDKIMKLITHPSKKYSLAPNNKFKVKMNSPTWEKILDELDLLEKKLV